MIKQKFCALILALLATPMTWATTIINDQPEGDVVSYNFTGYATTVEQSDVQALWLSGGKAITDIVYAPDGNTVYMRNILPPIYSQAWMEGQRSADGRQLTFALGQALAVANYGTDFLVTTWIEGNVENDILDIALHPEVADITFTVGDDGTLTLQGTSGDAEMHDVQGIAVVQQSNQAFFGYMTYGLSLIPSNSVPLVAPDNLVTSTYSFESGLENHRHTRLCEIAFEGNSVWMNGLVGKDYGTRWARGSLNPTTNQITIPSGQYLGVWRGHSLYWQGVNSEKYNDPDWGYVTRYLPAPEMVFDYDPVTHHITSDMTLLFTTDTTNTTAYIEHLDKPVIKPYQEQAVTPATPSWEYYDDESFERFGARLSFYIPERDVNGEYIDPANLSYRIFVDNEPEPFVFEPDEYKYLTSPITEIPYGYTDYWDFYGTTIILYERGFERVGLQSICRIGDAVSYSEVAWYEFEYPTPDYGDPDFGNYPPSTDGRGDSQVLYGNYRGKAGTLGTIGFTVSQDYDMAMRINDPNLLGCTVTALRIPVQLPANGQNYRAWLSHDLAVTDNQMMPDIACVLFDPQELWTEVRLAEPWVITAPFFAGFSFTIPEAGSSYAQKPLVVMEGVDDNGVWIRSSRTYRRFEDFTHRYSRSCASPVVLVLEGDLRQHAATITGIEAEPTMMDTPFEVTATLRNHGASAVRDVDIRYEIDGQTGTLHIDLADAPIAAEYYGEAIALPLTMPAIANNGLQQLNLTVTHVNGQPNEDVMPSRTADIIVLGARPVHRAVLEEYTGTWCGWCPRGFVGLQRMNEAYPDQFIGISYHNNDPMEIMSTAEFPSSVMSFPAAFMDRTESTDAYGGDNGDAPFGIDKVWLRHAEELAIADVSAEAAFDAADDSLIHVEASIAFIRDIDQANYVIGYVLTADQLTDKMWYQSNYYSGSRDYDDDPAMAPFVNGDKFVLGLKFDDVAILAPDVNGIDGSLPASIAVNQTYRHQYDFDLRRAISTEGNNLVQDRGRLNVIVLLIDRQTHAIANACKVRPAHELEAIEHIAADPTIPHLRYNLMGQPTTSTQGITIFEGKKAFTSPF